MKKIYFKISQSITFLLSLPTIMKILACILSFYIIVLQAIPCADYLDDNCLPNNQVSHLTKDSQTKHTSDYCSPFCTCNCCTSPIIHQVHNMHFECYNYSNTHTTNYIPVHINELSISIWQPPKIA